MEKHDPGYEEVRVRGVDLAPRVGDLLRQNNVRRLMIRNDHESTLLEIPVSQATVETGLPSVMAAVSAMGATLPGFRVVILRTEQTRRTTMPAATSQLGATEDQMNTRQMVAQRIDNRGTRVEDLAGTGEHDAPGG